MSKLTNINWDSIEAEYIYSPDKISIAQLVKKLHKSGVMVSQGTIGNKARDGNWVEKRDKYWKKVSKNVERRITTQITRRRIHNVKIVDAAIKLGARNLLKKLKNDPDVVLSAGEIDKLMRLQEFLLGFSDSRQEKRIITEKPLEEMSEKELEELESKLEDSAEDADFEEISENSEGEE